MNRAPCAGLAIHDVGRGRKHDTGAMADIVTHVPRRSFRTSPALNAIARIDRCPDGSKTCRWSAILRFHRVPQESSSQNFGIVRSEPSRPGKRFSSDNLPVASHYDCRG